VLGSSHECHLEPSKKIIFVAVRCNDNVNDVNPAGVLMAGGSGSGPTTPPVPAYEYGLSALLNCKDAVAILPLNSVALATGAMVKYRPHLLISRIEVNSLGEVPNVSK
jgi:hypothetical protein